MEFLRPKGLLSGFHAGSLEELHPAIIHAGEQWVPTDFFIDWHEHPCWELYLQVHGRTRWEDGVRRYEIEKHDLLAVPPDIRHRMAESTMHDHHFLYVALIPSALKGDVSQAWDQLQARSILHLRGAERLAEPFRYLIREISTSGSHKREGLEIAARALLLEAQRLVEGQPGRPMHRSMHPAVAHCRELIEQHPEQNWTLEILGKLAGLSPNYLLERFRNELAITPHQYLIQCRIQSACEQLTNTDRPLTELAIELGFNSSQHFSNAFRKARGMSPSAYRKGRD